MRYIAVVLACGCAIGSPPGFSPGDTWTFPLVDPLSGGRLVVPVTIHGKGPYLFAIDRDAVTMVDAEVPYDLGLRALGAVRVDDYDDHGHPAFYGELTDFEVGNLTISLVAVEILPAAGGFDEDGRRIAGVLGRTFIADSLVFGFDRDRGIAWLTTQQAFTPPAGATELELDKISSAGVKVTVRPVVKAAKIGDTVVDLHPDFSRVTSELSADKWQASGLAPTEWGQKIVDDASGVTREVSKLGVASRVTVAAAAREHVGFIPYDDKRLWRYKLDGVLGLDFFRPFKVAADWHHEKIYLTPREDLHASLAVRVARWPELATCAHPGCATIETLQGEEGKGPILRVHRDGYERDLEIVVNATGKSGEPLPSLALNLPADTAALDAQLETRYLGATFDLVDASPFPRRCEYRGGCVMTQAPMPP